MSNFKKTHVQFVGENTQSGQRAHSLGNLKSDEEYRLLAENVRDVIWTADLDLNMTYISPSIFKLRGYTVEEVMSQPLSEILTPASLEAALNTFSREIELEQSGEADKSRSVMLDLEQKCLDGSTVWTEIKITPLRDEKGQLVGILGVTRDIHKRKKMEEELERKNIELNSFINNIPDLAWIKNLESEFIAVNRAFADAVGMTQSSLIDNTCAACFGEEGARKFKEDDRKVLSSRKQAIFEEKIVDSQGNDIWLETIKSPIFDGTGNIMGTVGIARNISKRKHAEEKLKEAHEKLEKRVKERTAELEEANAQLLNEITERKQAEADKADMEKQFHQAQKMESIGRLAGGVAHDFNNLLTAIIGYSTMIKSSLDPNDSLFSDVKEIMRAADSAAQLTSQLLAFARKQTIDPKVVNINQTVRNSQKMLKRLIEEDIELVLVLNEDLWQTKVDPGQIEQVLVNLTVNARDAMPGGGALTIETANVVSNEELSKAHHSISPGDYVMLTVSDDGCGMNEKVLENIFEPFYTTKGKENGTGLGLSTVYGIVKQHNGYIYAHSESGIGTSIKIYLPRVMEEVVEISKPVAESTIAGKETILVAEDQEMVRNLTKKVLEQAGYHVLVAEDGGSAFQKSKKYKKDIHLLLTDVVMPNMNGRDLHEQIVSMRPGIKVLYMSGYTEDVIANRGILEKDTPFIQKPFGIEDLLQKVRKVLGE